MENAPWLMIRRDRITRLVNVRNMSPRAMTYGHPSTAKSALTRPVRNWVQKSFHLMASRNANLANTRPLMANTRNLKVRKVATKMANASWRKEESLSCVGRKVALEEKEDYVKNATWNMEIEDWENLKVIASLKLKSFRRIKLPWI